MSFGMLIWDSIFHLAPEAFLAAFIWFKDDVFLEVMFQIDGFLAIWSLGYGKYSDKELFEKVLVYFHDVNAIFFELAFAQTTLGILTYWSFLHKWI